MSIVFKCAECGGTNVYDLVWVNPNDGHQLDGPGRAWCGDCQSYDVEISPVREDDTPSMFNSLAIALKPDFTFG